MVLNWNEFNKWRETSLQYHKMLGEHNYTNALTFFEYARQYFNAKGFPPTEKKTKTGRKGKYTQKDSKEQLKQIHEYIGGIKNVDFTFNNYIYLACV